jgi:plasmid stabilization system protein ParE
MTRAVHWSTDALRDLDSIVEYQAGYDAAYASKLVDQLEDAGEKLGQYPTGRPGRVLGTFEKSLPRLRYIMVYRLEDPAADGAITIVRVIHSSQDWRDGSWPE